MATFVRTASIYIDMVDSPEGATQAVENLNECIEHGENPDILPSGSVRLADDSPWEKVSD